MIEANPELLMINALREHIVLQHVNQTELQFSDIQGGSFPDRKTCIFYLSLRNLVANPQYLSSCTFNIEFERLILICYVDTPDVNSIEAVNKFCCLNAISLILAWDNAELGRYVETITVLLKETGIGECNNLDFLTITFSTLSEITCLNKLDVSTFINIFPDLLIVLNTSVLGFASVPGIGMRKAQHITSLVQNAFH
jgi:hypothetical protein